MKLGVDLGTSHTVAMLHRADWPTRPLLFDGKPLLPSAVYLDTTGRLHVGADALRLGRAEPGRLEPHPKRRIDDGAVLLGDGPAVPVSDLLAAVLTAVAREAVATAGFLPPAVVTHPAAWGAPRRAFLVEALGKAGWPAETELVPEPVAAARYFAEVLRRPLPVGAALAVFDFGGGTLDVAVVRHDGPGPDFAVTASGGADDLGGIDLDAALVDHLGKSLAGGEPEAWQALTAPATLGQWRARRQFWEDVRGAKEMLSRSPFAPIPVPGVEHAVHLTRDELEAAVDPLVRRGVAEAAEVIAAAGLTPADLAGLFLVGGSSRVPLVARLLHSELGVAPTVLEQPELPVAEGATLVGGLATGVRETPAPAAAGPSPVGTTARPASAPPAETATQPSSASPAETATQPSSASPADADTRPSSAPAFSPGVAAAATPTPTPATSPQVPPPITDTRPDPAPPVSGAAPRPPDDRHYGEPVDPWATGEAAAFGHGLASPPFPADRPPSAGSPSRSPGPHLEPAPPPGGETWLASAPRGKRSRRRTLLVAGAAVLALVIAAGVPLAWKYWPRDRALDYHALGEPRTFTPAVPISTASWSHAAIRDDRAYFASSDNDGAVAVTAVGTDATKATWTQTVTGVAKRWESMTALPDGVALFSADDTATYTSQMVVLAADDGARRWQHTLGSNDSVSFAGDVAIVDDREGKRLVGLSLADGRQRWALPDPAEGRIGVRVVTTPADLAGPADFGGRAFDADLDDDPRIVQIAGDRSVRVIDANTGEVRATRQNVADHDEQVIAHHDRLIVVESEDADRVVVYSLDKIGEPDVVYTTQFRDAKLTGLTACGDDRICVIEGTGGYADEGAQVVALDVTSGERLWHVGAPGTGRLTPVGEGVLATGNSTTTLIDTDGTKVWTRDAAAGRLDATNVLEFSTPAAGYPVGPALAGRHLGDDPVQLGPLSDVIPDTCAWNTSVLACVAKENFVLVDFAG